MEHNFDICRTSTRSDVIIPNYPSQPVKYKMAAVNLMCYKAVKCLKNKLTLSKDMEKIQNIIKSNNYKPKTVGKIVKRIRKRRKE